MIRAVFDANVLASLFTAQEGTLVTLRRRLSRGDFALVVSQVILDELATAWNKPYWQRRVSPRERELFLLTIERQAKPVVPTVDVRGVASHVEDDPILATSVSGFADFLVTGDRELLGIAVYEGVQIVTARQFVEFLDRQ